MSNQSFDGGSDDFWTKLQKQLKSEEKNEESKTKQAFAEIMWLQYLPVAGKPKEKENGNYVFGKSKINAINNKLGSNLPYYNCDGCAGYGMAQMRLDSDLADLVLMFYTFTDGKSELSEQIGKDNFKKRIIDWCLDIGDIIGGIRSNAYKNVTGRKNPQRLLPIHNMLLYLCKPEQYAPICSSSDKEKIVKTFEGLLNENEKADDNTGDNNNWNNKIHLIKEKLNNLPGNLSENGFYGPQLRSLWNVGATQSDALKFKKALILYGPPGTSKTYTSTKLAENLIYQLNYQNDIGNYFKALEDGTIKKHIHRLQLHPNYTYEDFIWGYQIENEKYDNKGRKILIPGTSNLQCVGSKTTPKKGYFLRLLDEIQKENQSVINEINSLKTQTGKETKISEKEKELKVHVLILDEINRVDLSRLFGELFSAIENRNEPVDLPVKIDGLTSTEVNGLEVSQISVPENLYIIGTMNEIDFSLERVDFALRRRFLWKFYGFNGQALYDILNEKQKKYGISKMDNESIIDYYDRCKALNDAINKDDDLGKQYEIGHTFFGEIIDLWVSLGTGKQLKTIQEKLWEVSIGPMIEAYLGNCDAKTKKEKIDTLKSAFIPEKDGKQ